MLWQNVFLVLEKVKRFEFYLIHIIKMEKRIMTTVAELEVKVTSLIDHVTKETSEVSATLKGFGDQIAALKAQLQGGVPATQANLDHLSAELDGIIASVDKIIPDAPVITPAPVLPAPVPPVLVVVPPMPGPGPLPPVA